LDGESHLFYLILRREIKLTQISVIHRAALSELHELKRMWV